MTWGDFQRQFDARGREKGDGYAPGDFAGMTVDECARARTMMLDRALRGDTIDLSGLRHIGDAGTAATLATAAQAFARLGWRNDIIRHEVLFELTGEQHYLTDLAKYLDRRDAEQQKFAAHALTWYLLPLDVEPFLLERICGGRHEAAILALLQSWIALHQRAVCDIGCFQHHIELIRRVDDAAPNRRRALLSAATAGLTHRRSHGIA